MSCTVKAHDPVSAVITHRPWNLNCRRRKRLRPGRRPRHAPQTLLYACDAAGGIVGITGKFVACHPPGSVKLAPCAVSTGPIPGTRQARRRINQIANKGAHNLPGPMQPYIHAADQARSVAPVGDLQTTGITDLGEPTTRLVLVGDGAHRDRQTR